MFKSIEEKINGREQKKAAKKSGLYATRLTVQISVIAIVLICSMSLSDTRNSSKEHYLESVYKLEAHNTAISYDLMNIDKNMRQYMKEDIDAGLKKLQENAKSDNNKEKSNNLDTNKPKVPSKTREKDNLKLVKTKALEEVSRDSRIKDNLIRYHTLKNKKSKNLNKIEDIKNQEDFIRSRSALNQEFYYTDYVKQKRRSGDSREHFNRFFESNTENNTVHHFRVKYRGSRENKLSNLDKENIKFFLNSKSHNHVGESHHSSSSRYDENLTGFKSSDNTAPHNMENLSRDKAEYTQHSKAKTNNSSLYYSKEKNERLSNTRQILGKSTGLHHNNIIDQKINSDNRKIDKSYSFYAGDYFYTGHYSPNGYYHYRYYHLQPEKNPQQEIE